MNVFIGLYLRCLNLKVLGFLSFMFFFEFVYLFDVVRVIIMISSLYLYLGVLIVFLFCVLII